MPRIDEIAPDFFRISTYLPEADLPFRPSGGGRVRLPDRMANTRAEATDAHRNAERPLLQLPPYTPQTGPTLARLAALKPKTLAAMHGSTFIGDGERARQDLTAAMREVLWKDA